MEKRRAIGIFSGSFNPVHKGHIAIARSFLSSDFISELWILLTPDPPHKKEETLASYHDRYRMLEMAFEQWDHVMISDIETDLPKPSFTLQTVRHLTAHHPNKEFYLCIGGDSAQEFQKWHKWREILSCCELLVAKRKSDDLNLPPAVADNAHIVEHEPIEISSTEIRRKILNNETISELVPQQVEAYIQNNDLYKNN